MSPDDPRHGSLNAYKNLRCRCALCSAAECRYEKRRKWLVHQGLNPSVPALGFQRRVQALMAIGWTQKSIADALRIATGNLSVKVRLNTFVYRATHLAMCDLYESSCMKLQRGPLNDRTARIAAKRGWLPPLAWIDIDDPNERPDLTVRDHLPDPVVVDRILAGDFTIKPTRSERYEVIARWPGSDGELERRSGWNCARDRRDMAANSTAQSEAS